jgi:electron transfer flavoprotein beta subunit
VPDTRNTANAMTQEGTVNREALPAVFNPNDWYALEAALQIKDANSGTKVNVLTMGPPQAAEVLRECLYRGADFTALVSDRGFAGADTHATSYTLTRAIEKIGAYDLILCGRQSIDGETAQVGPQTAEKLGINQITCVSHIESLDTAAREITAVRSIEGGWEKVKARLPILLTLTEEGEPIRPASAVQTLARKRTVPIPHGSPMALWDIAAISADPQQCGCAGSPTQVKDTASVTLTANDITYCEPDDAGMAQLIGGLIADHILG